jgi:hypothetical protein
MRVSVTVDTQSLSDSLHRLASVAREAPGIIIKEETKALVKNIWQLTPPKTYAQGRAAVQGDMSKLLSPLNADTLKDKQMADAVRGRDAATLQTIFDRMTHGAFAGMRVITDQSKIRAEHMLRRNPRGRVTGKPLFVTFLSDAKKYTKSIQERVGWAKAGWGRVAQTVGLSVPAWSRKLVGSAGAAVASFGTNPSVFAVAYNNKIPGYQAIVSAAVRNRIRVTETKIKRLIAGKAVNLGFKRVDAR